MVQLRLEKVSKDFGEFRAVNEISFEVNEGEILTLLGPSGCGKSTTLRMIAGFLYPDEGRIFFDNEDITDLPPQNRGAAMVFQSYALWPHLSVYKNVEYGLNIRKIPKEEKQNRVMGALEKVQMGNWAEAMPNKLSGGQQQRVAVARALVVNPAVLLLDEPLSNLDAKLRVETRQQIRDLVKELQLTTIYVTHDQSEALSISDRIAVLDVGHLRQIGSPEKIWETPHYAFVGSFIGEANTVEMIISEVHSDSIKLLPPGENKETTKYELTSTYFRGEEIGALAKVVIRPEDIEIFLEFEEGKNMFPGVVHVNMFFGSHTLIVASLGENIFVNIHVSELQFNLERNQQIFLCIKSNELRAFGPSNY